MRRDGGDARIRLRVRRGASRAGRAPRTWPMCDKHSSATSSRLRRTLARPAQSQAAGCVSFFAARNARSFGSFGSALVLANASWNARSEDATSSFSFETR